MAIGRFRDAPREMDEIELRVAAAQYPEGGLVLGSLAGVALAALTVDALLFITPLLGSLMGYALGVGYRRHRTQRLRSAHRDGE